MAYRKLNHSELCNLADLYVSVDDNEPVTHFERLARHDGLAAIIDAECELVCWVPKEKAHLLARLINTYEHEHIDVTEPLDA